MQLVLHTGVHFTEEERLLKSLLRNTSFLSERGVAVPGPGKYRGLLRATLNAMSSAPAGPEAREVLLDAILDDSDADRVVLSDPNVFRTPNVAFNEGRLYAAAGVRLARLAQVFAHDQIEIFLAIRNPATFLPEIYHNSKVGDVEAFLQGQDPRDVAWSQLLAEIRQKVPQATVTVWCSEDMPLLWAQIIREIAGLEPGQKITGGFDLLSTIMSKEGMTRFRAYLKKHPIMTEVQKRRAITAFLDKYALEDEIEAELDMPGWTDELVQDMTDAYDDDLLAIQRIPGVNLLLP